ncbi:hypothetical protein E2C01_061018 [Portunus trituberculatus]|uniref:Uncharacterized protein n=1 Tax=Portunus trituberculatus TaxID=210409 RepID=A0A5B7H9M3_PORTR|nr:hypothetical protein [Portunus trituberculatus]
MKKKLRKVSIHFGSPPRKQSNLGTFLVPFPEGDSEAGFGLARMMMWGQAGVKMLGEEEDPNWNADTGPGWDEDEQSFRG